VIKTFRSCTFVPQRATWPTFDRSSLVSVASDAALLEIFKTSSEWHLAGLQWRTRFLLAGEVYRHKPSKAVFRSLGSLSGACLGWLLEPVTQSLDGRASAIPDCFQMRSVPPQWFAVILYDDFEALPCKVLSPYGVYARGMSEHIDSGVVLWHNRPSSPILQHAARLMFRGLRETDIQQLAKESQVNLTGKLNYNYLLCCLLSIPGVVFFKKSFPPRLNKAEASAALARKLLPDLTNEELSELLLESVVTHQPVVQIDSEALAGLVGEAEARIFQEAAEPLPAEVSAANQEFQSAAAALRASRDPEPKATYWQGSSAPATWAREVVRVCLDDCFFPKFVCIYFPPPAISRRCRSSFLLRLTAACVANKVHGRSPTQGSI
jgi:hypothetical protein